jgi:branched-chain amino acid transport system ATP-binding protein
MIAVDKVRAGYGDGPDILQGIDLAASAGEIVTILGPNGCGKSTLLKCVAGYVRPRGGTVSIEGRDITAMPVHQRIRRRPTMSSRR